MNLVDAELEGIPLRRVGGESPAAGWGAKAIFYVAYVERGVGVRPARFVDRVEEILADERGWIRGGKVSFQRVGQGGNTQLILATPATVDRLCAPLDTGGEVSCCQGTKVVINAERWRRAVPHWTGTLGTYRAMLIQHEFGHRISKPHRWCSGVGELAAVMQQQTLSLQGCRANSWPLDQEL